MSEIRIGIIDFLNCLPILYSFEKWGRDNIKIFKGHPVFINNLLKQGEIFAAPVSSIEYIKNKEKYLLIKSACISSNDEIESVLLFSKYNINELEGKKVYLPYDSATSSALLKIILNEQGISPEKVNFTEHNYGDEIKNADVVLYIGDNALIKKYNTFNSPDLKIYDIGGLWRQMTGLPAVFGTFVAEKKQITKNSTQFAEVENLIKESITAGLGVYFDDIINIAFDNLKIDKKIIENYLKIRINYNFTETAEKSLERFEFLYKKLNCE